MHWQIALYWWELKWTWARTVGNWSFQKLRCENLEQLALSIKGWHIFRRIHNNDQIMGSPKYKCSLCDLHTRPGPRFNVIRRLIVRCREVSKPRDLCLELSDRSQFDRPLGSSVANAPAKFQSDAMIQTNLQSTNLTPSIRWYQLRRGHWHTISLKTEMEKLYPHKITIPVVYLPSFPEYSSPCTIRVNQTFKCRSRKSHWGRNNMTTTLTDDIFNCNSVNVFF